MNYDGLIAEWQGKQVTKFGGQCVALVAEFEAEAGRPIVWGDASAWVNNPTMLQVYDWIANDPNDPNQIPNRGEIVVWGADLPYTAGAGHIAFFDHPIDHLTFTSFGQNSGGPVAHFQTSHWAHVAGWYRFRVPVVPSPAPLPYSIEQIPNKNVRINKDTHKWRLDFDNFTAIVNNSPETVPAGDIKSVNAILHHNIGYNYYLEDPANPIGYNVLDCDDIPVAVPIVPVVAPLPPPAAPVPFIAAEKYELVTTVMTFDTDQDAQWHKNAKSTLDAGTYFVYKKNDRAWNLTKNNVKEGVWVNIDDNLAPTIEDPIAPLAVVPTPVPELVIAPTIAPEIDVKQETKDMATDWRKCTPLKTDAQGRWQPVKYRSTNAVSKQISSLDGNTPANITLPAHKELMLVSTFMDKKYVRDDLLTKTHRYYALPFDLFEKVVEPVRAMDRDNDGDVDIHDYIDYISDVFKPVFTKTVAVIKTQKPRKFLDGIIAKNKDKVQ